MMMGRKLAIPEPYCSSEWVQQWDNPELEQPPRGDERLYPKLYDGVMVRVCHLVLPARARGVCTSCTPLRSSIAARPQHCCCSSKTTPTPRGPLQVLPFPIEDPTATCEISNHTVLCVYCSWMRQYNHDCFYEMMVAPETQRALSELGAKPTDKNTLFDEGGAARGGGLVRRPAPVVEQPLQSVLDAAGALADEPVVFLGADVRTSDPMEGLPPAWEELQRKCWLFNERFKQELRI